MARKVKIDKMDFVKVTKLADETSPQALILLNLEMIRYLRADEGKTKVVYGNEGFFVLEDIPTILAKAGIPEIFQ